MYVHVHTVMERLAEQGLVINAEMCEWGLEEADYLGHRVSTKGKRLLQEWVATIRRIFAARDSTAAANIPGNFYRWFLKGAAFILRLHTEVLKGEKPLAISIGQPTCRKLLTAARRPC